MGFAGRSRLASVLALLIAALAPGVAGHRAAAASFRDGEGGGPPKAPVLPAAGVPQVSLRDLPTVPDVPAAPAVMPGAPILPGPEAAAPKAEAGLRSGAERLVQAQDDGSRRGVLASIFSGLRRRSSASPPPVAAGPAGQAPAGPKSPILAPADPILQDIVANPPAALVLDYDGTLADRGPDGMSLPTPPDVLDRLVRLRRAGLPMGIATGRNLDYEVSGVGMMTWSPLISLIPAELRGGMYFSGRMGGEFALFDAAGRPVRVLESDWSDREEGQIESAIGAALERAGVPAEAVKLIHVPGQSNLAFAPADERVGEVAARLAAEFEERGLAYPVQQHKNWISFGKFDKGDGMRLIYAAMKARGLAVPRDGILYVGDSFRLTPGRPPGGDVDAAEAFPLSRAVSVGDSPGDPLPPNVRLLKDHGTRGTLAVLDAVLDGLSRKKIAAPPAPRAPVRRGLVFAAGLAIGAAPWLLAHSELAAAAAVAVGILALLGSFFRSGPRPGSQVH